jgi:hypothetical protein
MRTEHRVNPELVTATRAFNTVTITVGGLYLATHSIVVTITGTAAASLFGCWTLWLARRGRAVINQDRQLPASGPTGPRTLSADSQA